MHVLDGDRGYLMSLSLFVFGRLVDWEHEDSEMLLVRINTAERFEYVSIELIKGESCRLHN